MNLKTRLGRLAASHDALVLAHYEAELRRLSDGALLLLVHAEAVAPEGLDLTTAAGWEAWLGFLCSVVPADDREAARTAVSGAPRGDWLESCRRVAATRPRDYWPRVLSREPGKSLRESLGLPPDWQ